MWTLLNHTPFSAHAGFLRDHHGKSWWQIWVKGTFRLVQGREPTFVAQQEPLHLGPVFADDDPSGLLLFPTDLAHKKPLVDLTLHASAQPDPDTARDLNFALGDWQKTVRLCPPQAWTGRQDRADIDRDQPIAPVTLDWRAAAGGEDSPANPLGQWHKAPAQLIYPTDRFDRKTRPDRSAGLGPVPPSWPLRQRYGGTYDSHWERTRAPLLPHDFNPAFWQAAPADQQLDRDTLRAGALTMTGLAGAGDTRSYELPAIDLDMQTKIGTTWHRAEAALQGLHLDLETERATVTYAANWPIPRASADVDIARSVIMLGRKNTFRVGLQDLKIYQTHRQGEFA